VKLAQCIWWRRNRFRIECARDIWLAKGRGYYLAWIYGPKDRNDCLRKIRRCRRNSDRLTQLLAGKSPWDTARMPGWEIRDRSFRLMEFGMMDPGPTEGMTDGRHGRDI